MMKLTAELLIQNEYWLRTRTGAALRALHVSENGDSIGVFENEHWHIVAGKLITGDSEWMMNPASCSVVNPDGTKSPIADTIKWVPVAFDPAWTPPTERLEGKVYV